MLGWVWVGLALARGPVSEATARMTAHEGPWTAYSNSDAIYVALDATDGPFLDALLLTTVLPGGLGSNPVGLDRGQLGDTRLVHLVRAGDRVLVEQQNVGHRAPDAEGPAQAAVRESFATSVLASLPVVAEDADTILVDVSDFLLTDLHDAAGTLDTADEGEWEVSDDRSRLLPATTGAFRRNLALFAQLTFTGDDAGPEVRSVAPDPRAITLTAGQLWISLPESGFEPRPNDPRTGYFGTAYADHATGADPALHTAWAARHRTGEPLVYYVDPGAPPAIRDALLDGARWWADAFGAVDVAYEVEVLPPDRSPYDVDVNVIQWVHRATRGWSYGDSILDPRTGEILKGHVTLGSQRVRHDRRLFEALGVEDATGLALARLRQLAAHEVGHTLGLRHNFAASTEGRTSVMDYPAPWLRLDGAGILTDEAYGVGVGAWDRAAIAWGYGANPDAALVALDGLAYQTDADARPLGAPHPAAALWDNGGDPIAALREIMAVRAAALEAFGPDRLGTGRPVSDLQTSFALVYLLHRYQIEATAKLVGGVAYRHGVTGGAVARSEPVPLERQKAAVDALVGTFQELTVPHAIVDLVPPVAPGTSPIAEPLSSRTYGLDPSAAAGTAATLVVRALLEPGRLARLHHHAARTSAPALDVRMVARTLLQTTTALDDPALRRELQTVVVTEMLRHIYDPTTAPVVRETLHRELYRFRPRLRSGVLSWMIQRHLVAPWEVEPGSLPAPMGPPIGCMGQP